MNWGLGMWSLKFQMCWLLLFTPGGFYGKMILICFFTKKKKKKDLYILLCAETFYITQNDLKYWNIYTAW